MLKYRLLNQFIISLYLSPIPFKIKKKWRKIIDILPYTSDLMMRNRD